MESDKSMDAVFITKLEAIIDSNLGNEQFGVNELAAELGLSRSQLHRKLKTLTGKSTTQFIREFKLEKAMRLLKDDVATASEIAYQVGFSSPTYFTSSFTKYFGFPPSEAKFRASNDSLENATLEVIAASEPKTFISRTVLMTLGILVLLIIGFVWFNSSNKNTSETSKSALTSDISKEKSIAVLSFKNLSNDEDNQYFADGIREDIVSQLSKINGIVVKSQMSLDAYASGEVADDKIGETLKVDYLINGSVQKLNDQIKIVSHLINASDGAHIWSETFNGKFDDIFKLESQISKRIAQEMDLILSPSELKGIVRIPTQNVEAHNLYLKGKHFVYGFTQKTEELAEKYLNESIALDPQYALPYAALAELYRFKEYPNTTKENYKKAKAYALKAIELDGSLSETHRVLGDIYMQYEWQWDMAEEEYKKALVLNPNNASTYVSYADFLGNIKGDFETSRQYLDMAKMLSPLAYFYHIFSAELYFQTEDYDMAAKEVERAKEIDATDLWAYWIQFMIHAKQGNNDAAIKELTYSWNLLEDTKQNIPPIMEAYEKDGINGAFRWINDLDINFAQEDRTIYNQNAYWIAEKFAFLGEDDEVFKWLEISYDVKNANMYRIKYNHFFKHLRSHPKFLELLKKMNLGDYNQDLKL